MIRLRSTVLNRIIKYDGETVTVKDIKKFGTRGYVQYSVEEIKILSEAQGITPEIHLVKSLFDGMIVKEAKG